MVKHVKVVGEPGTEGTAREQWKDFHQQVRLMVRCDRDPVTTRTIGGRAIRLWRNSVDNLWYAHGGYSVRTMSIIHVNRSIGILRSTLVRRKYLSKWQVMLAGTRVRSMLAAARVERRRQAKATY